MHHFILNLTIAICVALLGGIIAYRLRQSPLAGYMIAGIIVGPFATNFIQDHAQIAEMAEVGVIFLMFAIGIEFSLKELGPVRIPAIWGTLLQISLLIMAGTVGGMMLGWTLQQSFFFGGIISISSTMVILKTLMDRGEAGSKQGKLLLSMLVVQDLAMVPMMFLLPTLASGGSLRNSIDTIFILLIKAALFVGITLWLGTKVMPKIFRYIGRLGSGEIFLLAAVALALGSAAFSSWIGLSPALGAFLAGMMLTESGFEHRVISQVVPMRDLFASLFFVSIGMLIDWSFIWQHLWIAALVTTIIILLKVLFTGVALSPFRLGAATLTTASFAMMPIGEFNFVLAQMGRSSGVLTSDIYNLLLSAAVPTIILTPLGFKLAHHLAQIIPRWPLISRWIAPRMHVMNVPDEGLQDHAVVIGYGRVGKRVARGLRQAGLRVVVVEREYALVRELQRDKFMAIYGDASYDQVLQATFPQAARILIVALPDFGAAREVVAQLRTITSQTTIVARASIPEDDVHLRNAGATTVVVPEIAGAFMMLDETLLLLGLPHDHIFTGIGSIKVR